jgi:hypothetical protein
MCTFLQKVRSAMGINTETDYLGPGLMLAAVELEAGADGGGVDTALVTAGAHFTCSPTFFGKNRPIILVAILAK